MKSLETLWRRPIYIPYLHEDLTDETVKNFEEEHKVKLPEKYIELLKIQNGGYIRFELEEYCHGQIYGLGNGWQSINGFDWEDVKEYVSFDLDGLIPFDGDGHWHLCLDYREDKLNPKISFIDIECDEQKIVANSFDEYLEELFIDVQATWAIKSEQSIDDLVVDVEKALGLKFENQNFYAHGYIQYRARLGNDWVFISSNEVQAGFIREGEEKSTIIDYVNHPLTKGKALQYPEISKNNYILSTFDSNSGTGIRNKLLSQNFEIYDLGELLEKYDVKIKRKNDLEIQEEAEKTYKESKIYKINWLLEEDDLASFTSLVEQEIIDPAIFYDSRHNVLELSLLHVAPKIADYLCSKGYKFRDHKVHKGLLLNDNGKNDEIENLLIKFSDSKK